MKALALSLLLVLVGCEAHVALESKPSLETKYVAAKDVIQVNGSNKASVKSCDKEIDDIALQALVGRLQGNDRATAEDGECGDNLTQEAAQISCLRDWANRQKDECVSEAYQRWLDVYDRNLTEAQSECRTHAERKSQAAFEANMDATQRRISKYDHSHKIPKPPPGCERLTKTPGDRGQMDPGDPIS